MPFLLCGLLLAGCESDERKLERLRNNESVACGLTVTYWKRQVPEVPIPGDSLRKPLYDSLRKAEDQCALAQKALAKFMGRP